MQDCDVVSLGPKQGEAVGAVVALASSLCVAAIALTSRLWLSLKARSSTKRERWFGP